MTRLLRTGLLLLAAAGFFLTAPLLCQAGGIVENEGVRIVSSLYSENEDAIFIPKVEGMDDVALQQRINGTLERTILSKRNDTPFSSLWGRFEVSFYNGRLLGIHYWGYSHIRGAAHPNKFDEGIHIDLTNGAVYTLADLFKTGSDYRGRILELCRDNEAAYRLKNGGQWASPTYDGWNYEREFAPFWPDGGSFLLREDSLRVYTNPSFAVGAISGYGVPYQEMEDLLDTGGSLWRVFQHKGSVKKGVESGTR